MDGETVLNTFYKQVPYKRQKDGWRVPFDANRLRGYKAINDLVDADTGRTVVEAGHKLTVRQARQLAEKGLKALRVTDEELIGHYIAEDVVNGKTGEIFMEAGEEITEKNLKVLIEAGFGASVLHRTGHSLGESVHGNGANLDDYETHDDRRLLPGAGFTIEPGVYFPDFGIRTEINMIVRDGSAEISGPLQSAILALV